MHFLKIKTKNEEKYLTKNKRRKTGTRHVGEMHMIWEHYEYN